MAGLMVPGSAPARNFSAIGLAAVAIGLLGQWLFVDTALGVNAPIAVAVLLAAAWLLRPPQRPRPRVRDAWLVIVALTLSVFAAVRGDANLITLDMLGAVALTGAALASFGGLKVVDRPFEEMLTLGGRMALSATTAGAQLVTRLWDHIARASGRSSSARAAPILRGLLIATPLVIFFVILFAAADAVFARFAGDLFSWNIDLGSLPARAAVAVLGAWLAAGLFLFVVAGDTSDRGAQGKATSAAIRLGSDEATTVLVVLDLLFAGFVAVQGAYLFGGQDTLAASGLTYAEYARRGFFELLAAAFAVGVLILALEATVRRRTRTYLVAAMGLVALTAVVLGSALLRLRLYQEAYGWTELRFYVLAAIAWLAIGCLLAIVTLATDRSRWLVHGMLALSILFGLGFNLIGPVSLVAQQNLSRAIHPELVAAGGETDMDLTYLASLGDDVIPRLIEALPALPTKLHRQAQEILAGRAAQLAEDRTITAWQSWNLSREWAQSHLVR